MRSYLSLVSISAKVRKKQNRMTLLCIIFAVFLVTAIFSMADMFVRLETIQIKESNGNWHIQIKNISESGAEAVGLRSDVAAASWYDTVNADKDKGYGMNGRETVLYGVEEAFVTDIMYYFNENASLQKENEIILTSDAKELLETDVGETITLNTPAGNYEFQVAGFCKDDLSYTDNSEEDVGAFINIAVFRRIVSENQDTGSPVYYVQFKDRADIQKAIEEIRERFGLADDDIRQNTILVGFTGYSDNAFFQSLYPVALFLFFLVLLAGVFMISGSLSSNIAQRTQFFGMMRCIGMSRHQVVRFVRMEALNWCKTAIPAGVILGTAASWALCALLRYFVRGDFSDIPVFGISAVGIISGALTGILTVLIAARSPAKRAAKVSPAAAVSGSMNNTKNVSHGVNTHCFKIETALGISHAVSAKKNLCLMAGSFALSIILFLCFSVLVTLLNCVMPAKQHSPDVSISGRDPANTIEHELADQISGMSGVKCAFGRMNKTDIPAEFSVEAQQNTVDLISYDDLQLDWLSGDNDLRKGSDLSKVYGDSNYVLGIWDQKNPLKQGDKIRLCGAEVEIAGMLKYSPFSGSGSTGGKIILICSNETFTRLTGEDGYTVVDVQVTKDASNADVAAIYNLVREKYEFKDRRQEADRSTSLAFSFCIYGFLFIIALITMLNIVNSVSMSVSARVRQYGSMRAAGMDGRQLTKMIAAEAFVYAFTGCVVGCVIGFPLHKLMYDTLVTTHFAYMIWSVPVQLMLIIVLFVFAAAAAAVWAPAKRMKRMEVTETINEL